MEKHGNPFPGGLAVFRGAAAEFVTAVQVTDQFGFAPAGDQFAAFAAKEITEVAEYHGDWSMTGGEW